MCAMVICAMGIVYYQECTNLPIWLNFGFVYGTGINKMTLVFAKSKMSIKATFTRFFSL